MKFLLVMVIAMFSNESAFSACASLVQGNMAFDVKTCRSINPERSFSGSKDRYQFIRNLPMKEQKDFYDSYRGLYVKGQVVKSYAVRSGLSPEKGALSGETIHIFIPPGKTRCQNLKKKRIKFTMDEACCEGGGDAPCLLPTTYVAQNVKVIGSASSSAGNAKQMKLEQSPTYKKANAYFRKKNYKKAAYLYEQLKDEGNLEVKGLYLLGYSYRKMDMCEKAIPPLKEVDDLFVKNKYWATDEKTVIKASLLLSRCYAKENKAEDAVLILERFLTNPKKYRKEIRFSLKNPDFGWIKTTEVYSEYKKEAIKALKK